MADNETARVLKFPDLKAARKDVLGREIGTEFDFAQRLYANYGSGDVFDYGEWTARDMTTMLERDGQASAIELVLTLPIREADKSIEPTRRDSGEAELANSVLIAPGTEGGMSTDIETVIGQVTSGQIYKKAFFEKVWKIREADGKVVYDKLAHRPAATCQVRRDERTAAFDGFRQQVWMFGKQGSTQRASMKVPGYVDIPRSRSFVYIHGRHREPLTGVSEMAVAYWCYQTKMKLLFLWYQYLENQALPRTVVFGEDQPSANRRAADVASMKSSAVVGMIHPPDGQKAFEVIGTTGDQGAVFREALNFLEGWQIGSVLAGFMGLTGAAMGGKGSYALSQDQSSFYLKSRQAVAKEMAAALTSDVIAPLILYNFGPHAAFPRFKFGPLQDEQIQALLTLFGQIVAAPALHIPIEFVDLLAERMATILQLDVGAVHQALSRTAAQRSAQLTAQAPPGMPPGAAGAIGQLTGIANAGTNITRQVAARNGGQLPPPAGLAAQMVRQPAGQPPRPPAKPPIVPPRGRMA